jgi:hypothetical protein
MGAKLRADTEILGRVAPAIGAPSPADIHPDAAAGPAVERAHWSRLIVANDWIIGSARGSDNPKKQQKAYYPDFAHGTPD